MKARDLAPFFRPPSELTTYAKFIYSSFNPNVALHADVPAVQNTVSDATPG